MPAPITKAGEGEHHVYPIAVDSKDNSRLEAEKHYIGIDAVAWFINKTSTWFSDRIASGTLDITLAGGLEKYQTALGVFELKSGSKTAPVFVRPVLPDRRYRGGPITIAAALTATKGDTAVAGMLKSAASASLGLVAGIVQTASITGPAKLLEAAGNDLVSGVKKMLADTGKKREALFDFSGLEFNMQPEQWVGSENFVLLHRGAKLNQAELAIGRYGDLLLPTWNSQPLEDGAWLLLRLRKSTQYSGYREWFDTAKKWRGKLSALLDDVQLEIVSYESALKRLQPSSTGNQTLFDEYSQLRTLIANDGVLTELEAAGRAGMLRAALQSAFDAIKKQDPSIFRSDLENLAQSLLQGAPVSGETGAAFLDTVAALSAERAKAEARGVKNEDKIASSGKVRDKSSAAKRLHFVSTIGQEDWALLSDVIQENVNLPQKRAADLNE
jgi:hypothetical protein